MFCISAEEKAREAESKRVAMEARLGDDLSKESRVKKKKSFFFFFPFPPKLDKCKWIYVWNWHSFFNYKISI